MHHYCLSKHVLATQRCKAESQGRRNSLNAASYTIQIRPQPAEFCTCLMELNAGFHQERSSPVAKRTMNHVNLRVNYQGC